MWGFRWWVVAAGQLREGKSSTCGCGWGDVFGVWQTGGKLAHCLRKPLPGARDQSKL